MAIIKKISSAETFSVKHPVLRKGKSMESCCFEDDDLENQRKKRFWHSSNTL